MEGSRFCIFAIYHIEEWYYYGPFKLDEDDIDILQKEIKLYNIISKKLVNGTAPDEMYNNVKDKELLRRKANGRRVAERWVYEVKPTIFELYVENLSSQLEEGGEDTGAEYEEILQHIEDTGDVLSPKEVRNILETPAFMDYNIGIGYQVLPITQKILKQKL